MRRQSNQQSAFTLIELIVVITILAIASSLIAVRTGSYTYWNEESFLRKFIETIQFLHYQAVQDAEHYQLEMNFETNSYRIGVLKSEDDFALLNTVDPAAGALTLELSAILNPVLARDYTLIPPPSFPSLAEPIELPSSIRFTDVRTQRGLVTPNESKTASIIFSPRGFTEFSVVHFTFTNDAPVTVVVNPFSGLAQVYREYREFEWTYGKKNRLKLANARLLSGFTLIEVTMAIVIMASALTILVGMQSSLIDRTIRGRNQQQAMLLARRILAGFELSDPEVKEGTTEMSAAEALQLAELAQERDPLDYAGYEDFRVVIQFNYWGIPKIDPQAMKRFLVRVMWSPALDDSLAVSYFIASEPQ